MSLVYEVKCHECGDELDFEVALDSSDDLIIKVTPCDKCIQENIEASKEE